MCKQESLVDDFIKYMDIGSESDDLEISDSERECEKQPANTNINKFDTLKSEFPNLKKVSGMHTKIFKRKSLTIAGIQGELVWDYLVMNEITFDVDNEKYSLFSSFSDVETSDVWYSILSKYE